MTAEDFWNRVKAKIKSQNTKQETLAISCGISYRTFQTWINRKTYPDALQTYLIAQALNTTVEYLVTGEEKDIYKEKYDNLKSCISDFFEEVKEK
jgi:bacteriophage CI repressor helix-turn-helix domain